MAIAFNEESDNTIKDFMLQNPGHPKPFKALSEILSGYAVKQIRDRWINKLDPRLDRSDFSSREKRYIDDWVVNNQQVNNKISWKNCQKAMEEVFGKVRSCEKIKNYYYSNQRSLAALAQAGTYTLNHVTHGQPALAQAGTSTLNHVTHGQPALAQAGTSTLNHVAHGQPALAQAGTSTLNHVTHGQPASARITVNSATLMEGYDKNCLAMFDLRDTFLID